MRMRLLEHASAPISISTDLQVSEVLDLLKNISVSEVLGVRAAVVWPIV
jgi:hypothetical protein